MKKYVAILVGSLFLSCATLNKTATKVKSNTLTNLAQSNQLLQTSIRSKLILDSSYMYEELIFWPKGVVKYSAAHGFEGEVFKMSVRSKKQQKQLQVQSEYKTLVDQSDLKIKQVDRVVEKVEVKAKSNTRFYAIGIVVLAFLGSFIYVVYKKKFR